MDTDPKPIISYTNTKKILYIWQEKYNKKVNDDVFLGNVDHYNYRLIQGSMYILLQNQSRRTKRGNSFAPEQLKVHIELKQQDFYFQKVHLQQIIQYFDQNLEILNPINFKQSQNNQINRLQAQDKNKNQQKDPIKSQISTNKLHQSFNSEHLPLSQKTYLKTLKHVILINRVPICPHHSLFIPFIDQKLPQKLTQKSIQLVCRVIYFYQDLMMGFNSIGAAASINNLHFHMFFKQKWIGNHSIPLDSPEFHQIHETKKSILFQNNKMTVQSYQSKYTNGFVVNIFSQPNQSVSSIVSQLNLDTYKKVYSIIQLLLHHNIPHNLLFIKTCSSLQIFIFCRKFDFGQIKFACMQYSGVFCLQNTTTKQIIDKKFMQTRLENQRYEEIVKQVKEKLSQKQLLLKQ